MMDRVDCRVFEDQLEAWDRGDLLPAGESLLRAHLGEGCPACAELARLRGHLAAVPLEALEAEVPDALVASMWGGVTGSLRRRPRGGLDGAGWLVPALAAAVLVLVALNGAAWVALDRATARQEALTEQLLDQQRRLVTGEGAGEAAAGRTGFGRTASLRALGAAETLTVSELTTLLREIPAGTPVIRAARREALARARWVPEGWKAVLGRHASEGDVTAGDMLRMLDELDLPGGATVPAGRILELVS